MPAAEQRKRTPAKKSHAQWLNSARLSQTAAPALWAATRANESPGGRHRFVVRFYLYDKERGVELAMGNISGEVDGSFGSVPFLAGDSEARRAIVAAIVNRTEIRHATSGR